MPGYIVFVRRRQAGTAEALPDKKNRVETRELPQSRTSRPAAAKAGRRARMVGRKARTTARSLDLERQATQAG